MNISWDAIPKILTEINGRLSTIEERMKNQQETNQQDLISVIDACKRLDICKSTFYKLLSDGNIETVKVGRRRLVKAESLKSIS